MKSLLVTATTAAVTLGLCAPFALSQDTRTVTEPVLPPVCTTLRAALTASNGIALADEQKLDTVRLQKALDTCGPGTAVELAADNANNAFLSGPTQLRKGVTLLIDKGVTLYASREPRVYEKSPGSCGLVSDAKPGCNTFIVADHADGAAIMGEGTIDGRGGSKLLVSGPDGLKSRTRPGGRSQKTPAKVAANRSRASSRRTTVTTSRSTASR